VSIIYVWCLNLTLLDKADEIRSIIFAMPCIHDLKFGFNSIGKQQSYLGSNVRHVLLTRRVSKKVNRPTGSVGLIINATCRYVSV
jgi:hypothetical protein